MIADLRTELAKKTDLLDKQWAWFERNDPEFERETEYAEQLNMLLETLREYEALQRKWNEVVACLSRSEASQEHRQLMLTGS